MPSRNRFLVLALAALAVLALAAGCRRAPAPVEGPAGSLAVAGFHQPGSASELLGGYLPGGAVARPQDLDALDEALRAALKRRPALGAEAVRQCAETVLAAESGSGRAFEHWLAVGRCLDVDWLLIPQVTQWRERDGSEVSVREPAAVTLWLHLLDVRGESFAARYKFEEAQQSLTENFLDAGKFLDRGGRWLTAGELASEGVAAGLKELGL
ncbi:hypothetical protein [Desulfocurvus vexinensis]|uniref:hypothetical protein n=1 Tax=Desulfocurvus vexinensis TaxID=399548 RepID=UPI00048F81B6|nr:hypothetical protein [Desulfocurvus vexinensis]